jgi:hypothetical protein
VTTTARDTHIEHHKHNPEKEWQAADTVKAATPSTANKDRNNSRSGIDIKFTAASKS